MDLIAAFLDVASTYARFRTLSDSRVSMLVFGDGTRIKHLRAGGDMGAQRLLRGLEWLSGNWPEGCVWPGAVIRPASPSLSLPSLSVPLAAPSSRGVAAGGEATGAGAPPCPVPVCVPSSGAG
jgi:hypothetical protein